ncbi:MAG: hypothetical protein LM632_11660, partial [Armatimonadetes bacterium]|nr:hypothetical protein [Armatimonadota bacterium]
MWSAKRWGVWIWTTAMTVVLVAYGFGQTHWCRTTEVTRMLMQHLGITEEKIRAVAEAQGRQAGRELP